MFPTDQSILEAGEVRKDLPCTAISSKSVLGFDLRYHGGYEVSIPLKDLAGSDNLLTVIFRVIPVEPKGEPVYLMQRFNVPQSRMTPKAMPTCRAASTLAKASITWTG